MRNITIALVLLIGLCVQTPAQTIQGKHPADTVTPQFFNQNSNAETTVAGINKSSIQITNVDLGAITNQMAAVALAAARTVVATNVPAGIITNGQAAVGLTNFTATGDVHFSGGVIHSNGWAVWANGAVSWDNYGDIYGNAAITALLGFADQYGGVPPSTNIATLSGLGTAAFTLATAYDASGAAQKATNGLGAAAFTPTTSYDPANSAKNATNPLASVAFTGSAASLAGTLALSALPSVAVTNLYFPNAFPASKMVLWLNGDALAGTNGQVVTNWPDLSGNGNNATNTANNAVVINTNSLNGHKGVTWQAGGSFLTTIAPLNPSNQTTIVTVSTHTQSGLQVLWCQPGNNYMYYAGATGGSLNGVGSAGSATFQPFNAPMIQMFLCDTNQITVRQNGIGKQLYGSSNYLLTNNIVFGAELGGSYAWSGDLDEVIVFNYILSTPEIYAVETYLKNKYSVGTGSKIMCIGDSLTDLPNGAIPYPSDLVTMLGTNYGFSILNLGQYGQQAAQWGAMAKTALGNTHNAGNDIAFVWFGPNDIQHNYGAGGTYSNIMFDCQLLHNYGYRVIAGTMIADGGLNDTNRIALNGFLRSGWTNFADGLADFGSDPILGNTNNCSNTNYYQSDQVHLTTVGAQLVANIAYPALINTLNIGGQYAGTFTGNGAGLTNVNAGNIVSNLIWGMNYYWQKPQIHNQWGNYNDCINYAGFYPLEAVICPAVTNSSMAALTFPASLMDGHTIMVNKWTLLTTNSSLRSVYVSLYRTYISSANVIVQDASPSTSTTYLIPSTGTTTNIVTAWTTNVLSVSTNQSCVLNAYFSGTNVYTSALLKIETWTY